ncbi:MAG: Lsm family RNA-binding protein [Candidatus Jordarchaeum sp.]|uniref:Lsm family RNA-binding protein n=1 Tax=Candidatus Jordarchaeum sp. TaxID=2823881 RepID=UPI004049724B
MSIVSGDFFRELSALVGSRIEVNTDSGKSYNGILKGYDRNTLSIVLAEAKDNQGTFYHRIFIRGEKINEIIKAEEPFDIKGLYLEIEKIFPPGEVEFFEDSRIIRVLKKVRVTEEGVEGEGPLADRIRQVYDKYILEQKPE